MRFADYFADRRRPVISFEVFPPKTSKAMDQLAAALPRLVALRPSYMTVTYGAFGTTQARTLEIAARIRREHSLETASHLTCVGATREQIDGILAMLEASGIENIVALRGDPPLGEDRFVPPEGGFAHASELVAYIRARGGFGLAVAGYPEKHIEAPDLDTDLHFLERKVAAGADVVITQLFYDNRDYFAFVEKARSRGVSVPIVPGLLSIQSYQQIVRITSMCGSKIPAVLRDRLEAAGEDVAKVREVGIEWTVDQCRGLLEAGVPGIHFYVLNRAAPMEAVVDALTASGHWPG